MKCPAGYNSTVWQYEEDVLNGKIVAGKLLKLAIQRHRRDLKEGHKRGLVFRHEEGQRILDFTELVHLSPDEPMTLFPFQAWELYAFYGWYQTDGVRRYTTKLKSCSRGSGKTPLEAVEIAYHLLIDGPYAAEAYVAANKEKQAKICFDDVAAIVRNSPELRDVLDLSATTVYCEERASKFSFLTANPETADGTRPTRACIDEYHEFDNDKMVGVLSSGLIKKPNSVLSYITTRGFHKDRPYAVYERKVAIPLLKGQLTNDRLFVVIYAQDAEDEINKPETWQKSNPMLCEGGVLKRDVLISARDEALQKGGEAVVNFKTKNLNLWCDAPTAFIEEQQWQASGSRFLASDLKGRACWGGLDMSETTDFTAFSLYFPPEGWEEYDSKKIDELATQGEITYRRTQTRVPGVGHLLWWFWIPEHRYEKRISDGLHQLRDWRDAGLITLIEGNVIDPRLIERKIVELSREFDLRGIAYDRYNATAVAISVEEYGIPILQFKQYMSYLAEPTKDLKGLILTKSLNHGHNPIATWMIRNAVPVTDINGNVRLTKDPKKAIDKIDGIVAAIMALGCWMQDENKQNTWFEPMILKF